MRILLDESLPRRLVKEIVGFRVLTVVSQGWSGKKNGELLKLAESNFDVFITGDQNLQYQINLKNTKILILVLKAPSNRFEDLKPLIPKILSVLKENRKGIIPISD